MHAVVYNGSLSSVDPDLITISSWQCRGAVTVVSFCQEL